MLTTSDINAFRELNLDVVERGVYGKIVSNDEVSDMHEEFSKQ